MLARRHTAVASSSPAESLSGIAISPQVSKDLKVISELGEEDKPAAVDDVFEEIDAPETDAFGTFDV